MEYVIHKIADDKELLEAWDEVECTFTEDENLALKYTEEMANTWVSNINTTLGTEFVGARPIRRPH